MIAQRNHQLTLEVAPQQAFVLGDPTRLVQIFANILNNAAKYTPAHGQIKLCAHLDGDMLSCTISDNGFGIAPEFLPNIFDLFSQTERSSDRSQGGLGIGLTLVKSLVELQCGSVVVESDGIGRGSRFTVRLPSITAPPSPINTDAYVNHAERSQDPLRILVVDDNVDEAQTLGLLLETIGHRVAIEFNGASALKRAAIQEPQVVFLDIGLPDLNGYELVSKLRMASETTRALIVAITGYGQPEDSARAKKAGFDHHLVKPVSFEVVNALLSGFSPSS